MKTVKCFQTYPVELRLVIKSEDTGDMDEDAYNLVYTKKVELLIPPSVGISIVGLWNPIKVVEVLVWEDHVVCVLEEFLRPALKIKEGIRTLERYLSDDNWNYENYSTRPEE